MRLNPILDDREDNFNFSYYDVDKLFNT